MAKDDGTPENPPSNQLREFRKLFNEHTNKGATQRKSHRRRPTTASPATECSPGSLPQMRFVARTPRSRNRKESPAAKSKGTESPAPVTPAPVDPKKDEKKDESEKKKKEPAEAPKPVAEAKVLAKADDEEFENAAGSPSNLAKCKIKQRELQWKPEAEVEDKTRLKVAEATVADKQYKSADETADVAIRRVSSRAPSQKATSGRKKTTGSGGSSGSAGSNGSLPRAKDTGVRGRKKRRDPCRRPSASPSAQKCDEPTTELEEIDQNSKDFMQAIKLMEILKRNNLLENALFPAQNEVVKAFFDGGMRNPDTNIVGLISKAMDFVLDAVFFRGEDIDCMIDNDLKTFIVDRSKSKPILLDVIISRPEFLPQSWGGRTVVLRAQAAEVTVHVEAKKEEKETPLVLPPPSMPLAVEPAAAAVPSAGGTSTHTLTNYEAAKIMFKIKSTNNDEYRLKPVFGFIDAGATAQVKITRLSGPPKEDKFVIQFAPAPEGATDAQEAFKGATPAGDVTLPCKAE